ncbi:alpha/beta fold hydrolase [Thalassotalea piscium]
MIKYTLLVFITLFSSLSISASLLPKYSSLVDIGDRQLHIRTMGNKSDLPTIILLSGPNQHWHSDSAWFALLQPLLAKKYQVISVDRAGNAWSSSSTKTTYQQFALDLKALLLKLKLDNIILVNFASSNLTSVILGNELEALNVKGMLWIDPDILLPHSISLYSDYPANWYQSNINKILPHIANNNWTEKTAKRNTEQVIAIEAMLPKNYYDLMDWAYFKAVQKQRLAIVNQQTLANEIAHYHQDLQVAAKQELVWNIPISIIDTDFELHGLTKESENYQAITKWQKEGSQWSQRISQNSQGQYLSIHEGNHLLMFQQPEQIENMIDQLIEITQF